jgi:prepilin-type N-terminal cleavage/methylation domain-containing protein/prepilin-type processing-associated H-X9-DG protein
MSHRVARIRGFTLVELLVVIGIIALLISILLPSLNRARQAANQVYCLSQLKQMGQAIHMYTNAHKGSLPIGYWNGTGTGGTYDPNGGTSWIRALDKYLGGSLTSANNDNSGDTSPIFHDKDVPEPSFNASWFRADRRLNYSVHQRFFDFNPGPTADSSDDTIVPFKLTKLRRASDITLIFDAQVAANAWGPSFPGVQESYATAWCLGAAAGGAWGGGYLNMPIPSWYPHASPNPGPNMDIIDQSTSPPGATWRVTDGTVEGQFRFRHMGNKVGNFLFADGHAAGLQYKRFAYGGSELEWRNLLPDGGN